VPNETLLVSKRNLRPDDSQSRGTGISSSWPHSFRIRCYAARPCDPTLTPKLGPAVRDALSEKSAWGEGPPPPDGTRPHPSSVALGPLRPRLFRVQVAVKLPERLEVRSRWTNTGKPPDKCHASVPDFKAMYTERVNFSFSMSSCRRETQVIVTANLGGMQWYETASGRLILVGPERHPFPTPQRVPENDGNIVYKRRAVSTGDDRPGD
jgi:hypothetical protein